MACSGTILDARVTYTMDDDGVHVRCTKCDWSDVIGFSPTVDEIVSAVLNHIFLEEG